MSCLGVVEFAGGHCLLIAGLAQALQFESCKFRFSLEFCDTVSGGLNRLLAFAVASFFEGGFSAGQFGGGFAALGIQFAGIQAGQRLTGFDHVTLINIQIQDSSR